MKVIRRADWVALGLGGRQSWEVVSDRQGSRAATLRYVIIPPVAPGETPRAPHRHRGIEEVYWVLEGSGMVEAGGQRVPVAVGDTVYMPAGEPHVTSNAGIEPLRLLCFFPDANIAPHTEEPASDTAERN